jgi:hypothetical protein
VGDKNPQQNNITHNTCCVFLPVVCSPYLFAPPIENMACRLLRIAVPRLHSGRRFKSTSPEGFLASASELFVSLRREAAHGLTASLPESERKELLNRLNKNFSIPIVKESNEDVAVKQQNSIAEAVAAARAEEAKKHERKWDEQKELFQKEAEKAAQARVASEIETQKHRIFSFQQWQNELEQHNKPAVDTTAHPVLGAVAQDLGYKRLHFMPAERLANIPVWQKQRTYRHDRAKMMAADKLVTPQLGMPGVITLHEVISHFCSVSWLLSCF